MSDELNPYPGNLKHHKVDAPARREPLFGHQDGYTCSSFFGKECDCDVSIYEEYRAKDAELIQRLVDGLKHAQRFAEEYGYGPLQTVEWDLDAAAAAGFKPSNE